MSKALFIVFSSFLISCSASTQAHTDNLDKQIDPPQIQKMTAIDYLNQVDTLKSPFVQSHNYGTLTKTGVILNNIEYKILIDTIDLKTLESMPQMKVQYPNLTMPNGIIQNSKPDFVN